jgi:hypothetical protein
MRKHKNSIKDNTREYNSWRSMIMRCNRKTNHNYIYYGNRGISVCDRWINSFDNFIEDMGKRPKGMTLDRINNDGNYEPSNCRWETIEKQNNNKKGCYNDEFSGRKDLDKNQKRMMRKRRDGLCVYCKEPRFKGGLCESHYTESRQYQKQYYHTVLKLL